MTKPPFTITLNWRQLQRSVFTLPSGKRFYRGQYLPDTYGEITASGELYSRYVETDEDPFEEIVGSGWYETVREYTVRPGVTAEEQHLLEWIHLDREIRRAMGLSKQEWALLPDAEKAAFYEKGFKPALRHWQLIGQRLFVPILDKPY